MDALAGRFGPGRVAREAIIKALLERNKAPAKKQTKSKRPVDNEFDNMFSHGSRLTGISAQQIDMLDQDVIEEITFSPQHADRMFGNPDGQQGVNSPVYLTSQYSNRSFGNNGEGFPTNLGFSDQSFSASEVGSPGSRDPYSSGSGRRPEGRWAESSRDVSSGRFSSGGSTFTPPRASQPGYGQPTMSPPYSPQPYSAPTSQPSTSQQHSWSGTTSPSGAPAPPAQQSPSPSPERPVDEDRAWRARMRSARPLSAGTLKQPPLRAGNPSAARAQDSRMSKVDTRLAAAAARRNAPAQPSPPPQRTSAAGISVTGTSTAAQQSPTGPSLSARISAQGVLSRPRSGDLDDAAAVADLLNRPPQIATPGASPSVQVPVGTGSPGAVDSGSPRVQSTQGLSGLLSPRTRQKNSEHREGVYDTYHLKRHHEKLGIPQSRFSQPRSTGPLEAVQGITYSFDPAHPALADMHWLRTEEQNRLLAEDRRRALKEQARAARQRPTSAPEGGGRTSSRALSREMAHLKSKRADTYGRLRRQEDEAEHLQSESERVQRRALDAIAVSARILGKDRIKSPSAYSSPYSAARSSPGRSYPYSPSPIVRERQRWASPPSQAWQAGSPQRARPYADPTDQLLNTIQEVDRMPQPERYHGEAEAAVQVSGGVHGEHARSAASLADYMAAASRPLSGPALGPDEFLVASGVYNPQRFESYNRQVDEEMTRRAETGYDSDNEREEAALREAGLWAEDEEEDQGPRDEVLEEVLQSTWEQQDGWMEQYRNRLGPQAGYITPPRQHSPQRQRPYGQQRSPHQGGGKIAGGKMSEEFVDSGHSTEPVDPNLEGSGGEGGVSVLTAAQEHLIQQPYVAALSPSLGYFSDDDGQRPRDHSPGSRSENGAYYPAQRRLHWHKSTIPKPFTIEQRNAARPRSLMFAKAEQDREIREREEQVARSYRFRARELPSAVLEPRYEALVLEGEVRRQLARGSRAEMLTTVLQSPFSFEAREAEKAAALVAARERAKDPNRFQMPIMPREVPSYVKDERLRGMMAEIEARKAARQARIREARHIGRERTMEEERRRQELANALYQERLRTVDPITNQRYEIQPPGALPDFNKLHSQWERQQAALRAVNRRRVTVPKEFLLNGHSAAEQEAAALKRRQRVLLDMQLDSELLPESRWPYKSPRGRVLPTPPPAFLDPDVKISNTKANVLRIQATQTARKKGAYQLREEREKSAREQARREAMMRAEYWTKMRQKKGGVGGGGARKAGPEGHGLDEEFGAGAEGPGESDGVSISVWERRVDLVGREDAPILHIEARHAQATRVAREMVEDAVLEAGGLAALKFVEGVPEVEDPVLRAHAADLKKFVSVEQQNDVQLTVFPNLGQ